MRAPEYNSTSSQDVKKPFPLTEQILNKYSGLIVKTELRTSPLNCHDDDDEDDMLWLSEHHSDLGHTVSGYCICVSRVTGDCSDLVASTHYEVSLVTVVKDFDYRLSELWSKQGDAAKLINDIDELLAGDGALKTIIDKAKNCHP